MKIFSSDKEIFNLPNAEIEYIPKFFQEYEANAMFKTILSETDWIQDDITVFGKTYKQPRLTALYGDSNRSYGYSGITMYPQPFTSTLIKIKSRIEEKSKTEFNTALLNLYRNGNDSNGWHADNEKELGTNPIIASVSFGENRPFHFKHKKIKEERYKILLDHGSLLIMKGEMQHYWLHQIAKTKKRVKERINITFRLLI